MKAFILSCLLAAVTASAIVPTAYHYTAYPWGISSYSYANSLLLPHTVSLVHRAKRAAAYYGPPAPLNRDGTVAYTPEIQQANAVHSAAYQQEFQRLQAAAALAAAHPDRTSPPSPDYNPGNNGQYNQQQYDNGQYNPAWNNPAPSAPAYNPAPAYNSAPAWNNPAPAYNSAPAWNNPAPAYNSAPSYNQGSYNPQPPAPLNPDGTAAHTREYQAIAASHQQAYHQALSRTKRSVHLNPDGTVAPTPEVAAATAAHLAALHGAAARSHGLYHSAGHYTPYQAAGHYAPYTYGHAYHYGPAPLNADGTVAETPEVRAAAAVHHSYVAKQLGDLAHQEAIAVSAGPGEGEGGHWSGHWSDNSGHWSGDSGHWSGDSGHWSDNSGHWSGDSGQWSGHWSGHVAAPYAGHYGHWAAAPLNHDGTVAPTPEVAAATAAHLAAHAHARLGHAY